MYRLFIVEDDPVIMERLQTGFDWNNLGYEICGIASDGLSALNMIPMVKPDVLLTDVEMPHMSGIELVEQLGNLRCLMKVVFLSAYDDFHYAREAFRLGAVDYLLKPLNHENVIALFSSISRDLKKQRQSAASEQIIQRSKADVLRQIVLSFLMNHRSDIESISLLLQHFEIDITNKFTLAAVCFMERHAQDEIERRLQHCSQELNLTPLFLPYQRHYLMLFPADANLVTHFLNVLLADDTHYQCLISNQAEFSTLPTVFSQLCGNLSSWYYLPMGQLVLLNSQPSLQAKGSVKNLPDFSHFFSCIKDRNRSRLTQLLTTTQQICKLYQVNVDLCIIHMAETCVKAATQLQKYQPRLEGRSFEEMYRQFQGCFCFDVLNELFCKAMTDLFSDYEGLCNRKGDMIQTIRDYVQVHYAEDLALSDLAAKFYVSPSYLSSVFSQQTGSTITEYIQQVRMEHAVTMLCSTDLSIADIATAVGYENYKHFWKLFKRHYQVTPKEYRARRSY